MGLDQENENLDLVTFVGRPACLMGCKEGKVGRT